MTGTEEVGKIIVLALDDDPERETKYRVMEDEGLKVIFVSLKDKNTSEEIKSLEIESPDIIFVDHKLNNTSPDSRTFMPSGNCVTPLLRNKWPKSPILGVTAAKDDCIEHDGNTFYEEVFDISNISQLEDFVSPVVAGYKELRTVISAAGGVAEELAAGFVGLLKAPEDEVGSILHSIPDELRSLEADSFAHAIFRWFRRTLHGHAGILYGKEWAAVTMGIGLDHFDRYSSAFDEAKYTGIWCDPGEPRWWKKRLYELAIAERTSVRESVQSAACKRFKVLEEHYCICSKCGKPWPEILAFTDEGLLADSLPTHLECSIPHPRRFVSLSFEEPRILVE